MFVGYNINAVEPIELPAGAGPRAVRGRRRGLPERRVLAAEGPAQLDTGRDLAEAVPVRFTYFILFIKEKQIHKKACKYIS